MIYYPIISAVNIEKELVLVYKYNYIVDIINLSLLVVFWHQYTQNKIIFSEYISNILTIYTVMVALEVLYGFSVRNDAVLHNYGQYFNAILNILMIILWSTRLYYLQKPESKRNEHYIENYVMLQGFVDKPRNGFLFELYSKINRSVILIITTFLLMFSVYIIYFREFRNFIKLNLLLLIISLIISTILAIVTWHKRWYNAIGFFFKRRKR
jgi:hypothetical protein